MGIEVPTLSRAESRTENEVNQETRGTFECLDSSGQRLCIVEYEFEEEAAEGGKGKILKSLILVGEKGENKDIKVNILEFVKKSGARIIVGKGRLDQYDSKTNTVEIERLDNAGDIGMLLHELGHAEQDTEDEYRKLNMGYCQKPYPERFLENIQSIAEVFPSIKTLVPWEEALKLQKKQNELEMERVKIDGLQEEFDRLKEKLKDTERDSDEYADISIKINDIKNYIREANKAYYARKDLFDNEFREFIPYISKVERVPTKVIERNATKRAFRWMRRIRKETGIDFYFNKDGSISEAVSRLKSGLKSYKAEESVLKDNPEIFHAEMAGDEQAELEKIRRALE